MTEPAETYKRAYSRMTPSKKTALHLLIGEALVAPFSADEVNLIKYMLTKASADGELRNRRGKRTG